MAVDGRAGGRQSRPRARASARAKSEQRHGGIDGGGQESRWQLGGPMAPGLAAPNSPRLDR